MARRGGTVVIGAIGAGLAALLVSGCASKLTDAKPVAATSAAASSTADPGCTAALHDVSTYGPSTVKLLAEGREAVGQAAVQLLVDGLDSAANSANSPTTKHAIHTLANAYVDYFDLTTEAVSIPLSTLLKDTADLEFVCR